MKTGTKIALGLAGVYALVGAVNVYKKSKLSGASGLTYLEAFFLWPSDTSQLTMGDQTGPHYMQGYSEPPGFVPPEYAPYGPGPSRVMSHVPSGYYDPRRYTLHRT